MRGNDPDNRGEEREGRSPRAPGWAYLCCVSLLLPSQTTSSRSKDGEAKLSQETTISLPRPQIHKMGGDNNVTLGRVTREVEPQERTGLSEVSKVRRDFQGDGGGSSSTHNRGATVPQGTEVVWKVGKGEVCITAEKERPFWRWWCTGGQMAVGSELINRSRDRRFKKKITLRQMHIGPESQKWTTWLRWWQIPRSLCATVSTCYFGWMPDLEQDFSTSVTLTFGTRLFFAMGSCSAYYKMFNRIPSRCQ